ncbi:MAG: aspartate kinase [bacterium]|nr:aspartate kinase [bacterium]
MALLVQKFGGTSVATPERMREIAEQVRFRRLQGDDVVLVVSAMGSETDELLRLAAAVADRRPGREMDMLITAGERKATALMCMCLADRGVPAESLTGSQAGFITDTTHQNARILEIRPDRVRTAIAEGRVPVVAGSQGVSTNADVTFLGRGGSDTTAVALAHVLDADACELYTDVSGVFTADPRVVPRARRIGRLSYDEMLEMTATGCPKPAMRSVEVARARRVRLHVRSAFTWEPGTWIDEEDPEMEQAIVAAVTHDTSEAKITVPAVPDRPGIAGTLFRRLADVDVNVDMIVQNVSADGATDISFTVPRGQLEVSRSVAQELADGIGAGAVTCDATIARVSLVGAGMKTNPGVAATMFEILGAGGINIEMISTSAIRISCVVREDDVVDAVSVLHDAFGLDQPTATVGS